MSKPKQTDKATTNPLTQLVIPAREEQIIQTDRYNSKRESVKKYLENFEQITFRLPKGSKDILKDYVKRSGKYESVNAMIKDLLEKEIGQEL